MRKIVTIPANLDIDSLLAEEQGRGDYLENLRSGIVYFLSLLCYDNYIIYKRKDGYRQLKGEFLDNIIGRGKKIPRRSARIKQILLNHGIIQIKKHKKGINSQGFRLTEKYSAGMMKKVELSEEISRRIEYYTKKEDIDINQSKDYDILRSQFEKHKLSIDKKRLKSFLLSLSKDVFTAVEKNKKFQVYNFKAFFNYFGYLVNLANDIEEGNYFFKVPETSRRFYSNLTTFPKILRPFLLIDGKEVGEIDIMTSQSYILATILDKNFYSKESQGFNMASIYPDLRTKIKNIGKNNITNQAGRNHFVTGVNFDKDMFEGIEEYRNIEFIDDYYTQLLNMGSKLYPNHMEKHQSFKRGREYIKDQIMNFLFEWNEFNRDKNPFGKLMEYLFPAVLEYVKRFNEMYSSSELSILLQRTEAFLMLNVCKELNYKYPDIPFYTIHDSIITDKVNIKSISDIMRRVIYKMTNKEVGIKMKVLDKLLVDDKLVNEIIKKIKINSDKQWENNRSYINYENIKEGIKFLHKGESRKQWYSKLNIEIG